MISARGHQPCWDESRWSTTIWWCACNLFFKRSQEKNLWHHFPCRCLCPCTMCKLRYRSPLRIYFYVLCLLLCRLRSLYSGVVGLLFFFTFFFSMKCGVVDRAGGIVSVVLFLFGGCHLFFSGLPFLFARMCVSRSIVRKKKLAVAVFACTIVVCWAFTTCRGACAARSCWMIRNKKEFQNLLDLSSLF